MDIQDLGAIGEFIASIAVLVTLVFLTVETRQNTRALRRANVKHTTAEHARSLYAIQDPEVSEIVLKGTQNLEQLSPLEGYRFHLACYTWLASIEQAFEDYALGHYPEKSLMIFRRNIPAVLKTPGGAQWWSERKALFADDFQESVERLLDNPPPGYEAGGALPQMP